MGLLKKIGRAVKKGGKFVGNVASKAAPLIAMVPGVGTLGGAALGAGGALLAGKSAGTALRRGALGAAGGLAGGAVRKLIGGRGMPEAPSLDLSGAGDQAFADATGQLPGAGLAEGAANTMRNSPALAGGFDPSGDLPEAAAGAATSGGRSLLSRVGRAAGSVGRGALGVAGGVGRFARDNPMLALQGGLAGLGALQGAQQQGEADAQRRQALNLVMEEPTPGAGGMAGFTDPTNPYGAQYGGGMNPAQRSARRALSGY